MHTKNESMYIACDRIWQKPAWMHTKEHLATTQHILINKQCM